MLPAASIRGWYIDQLRKGLQIVHSVLSGVSSEDAATFRDGGTGWTILEVMGHLRDYEGIFHQRASMSVEEDLPQLPNPNPDTLASENHYNEQDLQTVYRAWEERRGKFLAYLESLDETGWTRVGEHPRRGKMTVQDQLALTAWHDVNHIEQITRILAERKAG